MTIRDYLSVIRQRILVVLLTAILTTSAAVLIQFRSTPIYEGKAQLLVKPLVLLGSSEELSRRYQFQRGAKTEAQIVRSTEVAKRVIARLNLDKAPHNMKPEDLLKDVTVFPVPETDVIDIAVTAEDPKLASDLANTFPEEYISFRKQQAMNELQGGVAEVTDNISQLAAELNLIENELKSTNPDSLRGEFLKNKRLGLVTAMTQQELTRQNLIDDSPLKRGVGEIIQFSTPPEERSNKDLALTAALGLIIGIPLSLGLALLLDALSDTIKTKDEAEKIVGAEALGVIPLSPEWRSRKPYVVTKEAPYSAAAEAFRTLRINLESLVPTTESRYFLLTSPGGGEGKTITTANLGVAFAEAGRSALIVSADLRRPRMHELMAVDASPGFSELLQGAGEDADVVREPSPFLYVIPSGTPVERPDKLLAQTDVRSVLEEITIARAPGRLPRQRNDENGSTRPRKQSEEPKSDEASEASEADSPDQETVIYSQPNVILLDSPAVLGAAEVSGLARAVDGVILILHSGVSKRDAAARAAEQIRRAGGKIVGIVVVGVRMEDDFSVYPPIEDTETRRESVWARAGSRRQ